MRQGVILMVLFSLDFLDGCFPDSNKNHISLLFLSLTNIGMNLDLLPILQSKFFGEMVYESSLHRALENAEFLPVFNLNPFPSYSTTDQGYPERFIAFQPEPAGS